TGATDAVRVDAEPRDAWFVANQIAHYVKENSFDLILTGQESIDYNGSQVAALLGELLNLPSVSIAKKLDINDSEAQVGREIEAGTEVLSGTRPLGVGTAEGVAEPNILNLRNIMAARTKPLQVSEAIEVEQFEQIERFETPAPRGTVKIAQDVEQLVGML